MGRLSAEGAVLGAHSDLAGCDCADPNLRAEPGESNTVRPVEKVVNVVAATCLDKLCSSVSIGSRAAGQNAFSKVG